MIYANGHQLCVIDTETTGLEPGTHEIYDICLIPVDEALKPCYKPFDIKIKPEKPIDFQAFNVGTVELSKIMNEGLDQYHAAELFVRWAEGILKPGKRLLPIAHNWPFDASFLREWLGPKTFNYYIDGRYRDTMQMAQFINDRYSMRHETVPFPKVKLSYIAAQLSIPHDKAHNALDDCLMTIDVLKGLMGYSFP